MIISVICGILLMIIIPSIAGIGLLSIVTRDKESYLRFPDGLIAGYAFIWAVIEIFSVPVAIYKQSFRIIVYMTSAVIAILVIVGLIMMIKSIREDKDILEDAYYRTFRNRDDIICFILFAIGLGYVIYRLETTWFFDEDDSRFLGNAVDILRSNRILAKDPTTGLDIKSNYGDFSKDIVSHWSVFIAYISRVSRIHPTILAHSVYPVVIIIIMCSLYWMIIGRIKGDKVDTSNRSLAMLIILAMCVYGYYSLRNSETFIMIRGWQGKATLSVVGILMLIWIFINISEEADSVGQYILLLLINISLCLMSSMGIVISAIMIAAYGLIMSIYKRKTRIVCLSLLVCIPNALLYCLSQSYTIDMYLNS